MSLRLALAGWYGSDNLGDELILQAMTGSLRSRGVTPVAISIDPDRTRADHGIEALLHRSPLHTRRLARSLRGCDGLILAGGVFQAETSPWNICFHTSRLRATARANRPSAAVGLGVGNLGSGRVHGRLQRRLVRSGLLPARPVVVRDRDSARRLRECGVRDVAVGSDPVLGSRTVAVSDSDTMCVILRPPNRRGLRTAASKARRPAALEIDSIATSLDAVASRTGLAIRLTAFQTSRDDPIHRAVADRLRAPVELLSPGLDSVLEEVGRSRLVVTMRYHGAVAALLHDRPAVLLDYSPKMSSLAAEGGGWAPLLDPADLEPSLLVRAGAAALQAQDRVSQARGELVGRLAVNERAIDDLLAAA